mgnify:CR=1 FL=1
MKSKTRKNIVRYKWLYIMMLPGMIYLLINNYIPMAGLVIAFKKVNFLDRYFPRVPWCGFEKF